MRWTKAPRIVETKLKSGKIKFQVVEHLVDGRRIRKSVGLENVDPTNRGLLSETRLIAKTMEGDFTAEGIEAVRLAVGYSGTMRKRSGSEQSGSGSHM